MDANEYHQLCAGLEHDLKQAHDTFQKIGNPSFDTLSNIRGGLLQLTHSEYSNNFDVLLSKAENALLDIQNHLHTEFPDALSKIGMALQQTKDAFGKFAEKKTTFDIRKLNLTNFDHLASAQLDLQAKPAAPGSEALTLEERKTKDAELLLKSAELPAPLRELIALARRIMVPLERAHSQAAIIAEAAKASRDDFEGMEADARSNAVEKAERRLKVARERLTASEAEFHQEGQDLEKLRALQQESLLFHEQARAHLESDPAEAIDLVLDSNDGIDSHALDFIAMDQPMYTTTPAPAASTTPPVRIKSVKRQHFENTGLALKNATSSLQNAEMNYELTRAELEGVRQAIPGLEKELERAMEEMGGILAANRAIRIRTWVKRSIWVAIIAGGIAAKSQIEALSPTLPSASSSAPQAPETPVLPPSEPPLPTPKTTGDLPDEKLPEATAEPLGEAALGEASREISRTAFRILAPLRLPDTKGIVDIVVALSLDEPVFMRKWMRAQDESEKEALLEATLSKIPEIKKAQMRRELLHTVTALMYNSRLATQFTPELSDDIFEAIYDQGWSEADEPLRIRIVEQILESRPGTPKKSKEQIIMEIIVVLKK